MCGIFGIVSEPGRFERDDVARALDTLTHRGPDDSDLKAYRVGDAEVWLGHRRLSIIGLGQDGRQPMERHETALVFNGEVYNHRALRASLRELHDFTTATDTEVLQVGMATRGLQFVSQANAMLAMAFLEPRKRRLTLARDRVGKKPLYVYRSADVTAFASELKAFVELGLPLTLDQQAWAYFRYTGYFPATMTAYRECEKLRAGTFEVIDLDDPYAPGDVTQYWDPLAGYGERFSGSYDDALDAVLALLDDATALRLDADVPVGAFLSGGVDSSLVVASIRSQHDGAVRAFTVGSDDPEFDESDTAIETARLLDFPIDVLHITARDYERQIAKIPWHYDEPLSDSSQIPTLAVAEQARKHVTVVLTGDGGDELFAGYPWFGYPQKLWAWRERFAPTALLRRTVGRAIGTRAGAKAMRAAVSAMGFNPDNLETKRLIVRLALASDDPAQLYDPFKAMWQREHLSAYDQEVLGDASLATMARRWYPSYSWSAVQERPLMEQLAALDQVTFMRDDVLVKVDRATMAYGLEARSPLLDHRIVEFACSLPLQFKAHDGVFKRILRDAVERRVGGDLSRLRKRGFGVPLPPNLPDAPTTTAQWSKFVEQQWRRANRR